MHSEAEAKKLWCPMARANNVAETAAVNRNANGEGDGLCYCIASACAAWRWAVIPAALTGGTEDCRSTTVGYCGLASKP